MFDFRGWLLWILGLVGFTTTMSRRGPSAPPHACASKVATGLMTKVSSPTPTTLAPPWTMAFELSRHWSAWSCKWDPHTEIWIACGAATRNMVLAAPEMNDDEGDNRVAEGGLVWRHGVGTTSPSAEEWVMPAATGGSDGASGCPQLSSMTAWI